MNMLVSKMAAERLWIMDDGLVTRSLGDNTRSAERCFTFPVNMIMQFVVPREIRKTRVP